MVFISEYSDFKIENEATFKNKTKKITNPVVLLNSVHNIEK